MKSFKTSNFTRFPVQANGSVDEKDINRLQDYLVSVNTDLGRLFSILQSNVTLGTTVTGKPGENIFGQWRTVADTGTVNTEFAVTHNLSAEGIGIIPANYFVTSINKGGVVYTSGTTWTTTTAYFKCSAANAAVNIFLMR